MSKELSLDEAREMENIASEFVAEAGQYLNKEKSRNARLYYSVAWGIYRDLENVELMRWCTRLLRYTGLSKQGIKDAQNWGYDWATMGRTLRGMFDSDIGEMSLGED